MAGGVVLEFSHFGDFDSFDIIRSLSPIDPSDPPAPIATGLMTMAYIDETTTDGVDYYYRAAVWRNGERLISTEEVFVTASPNFDTHWADVVCLLEVDGGLIVDSAPLVKTRVWSNSGNKVKVSNDVYLSDQSIHISTDSNLVAIDNIVLRNSDFTFECFVKPIGGSPTNASILGLRNNTSSDYYFFGFGSITTNPSLGIYDSGAQGYRAPTTNIFNTWAHIAITRVSGKYNTFVNGKLLNANIVAPARDINTVSTIVGASNATGGNQFEGYIEQIRVTKGVVRYTADFTPPNKRFYNGK